MLAGFKAFILRGNVIDLAVAVVIGMALIAVIDAIVNNLINPLIAAVGGVPALSGLWMFEINNAMFSIGAVLAAVINFVIVAAAVYFVIVLPMNRLAERRNVGVEPEPEAPAEDVALLREIRDLLAERHG